MYTLIFICLCIYYSYFYYYKYKEHISTTEINSGLSQLELVDRLKKLQNKLHNLQIDNQICNSNLVFCTTNLNKSKSSNASNASTTTGPERQYISPTDSSDTYTVLGFVYKANERYPLYGRHKYPGRSDRWEYYIIDESRNRLKIPFETTNNNELFDGDYINIPTLGDSFSVKIYDYTNFRYNPNI